MSTNEEEKSDKKDEGETETEREESEEEGSDDHEEEGEDSEDDKSGEEKESDRTEKKRGSESPEDRVARLKRQLKQAERKAGIKNNSEEKSRPKSGDMDYGQKAFLKASGISSPDEIKLVKKFISNTGKSLEEVVESKYFQAELKEMRDFRTSKDALPKGKNRSGQSGRDTVDYWIGKGELPPNTSENAKLRQDVVNARLKTAKDKNVFTDDPTPKR